MISRPHDLMRLTHNELVKHPQVNQLFAKCCLGRDEVSEGDELATAPEIYIGVRDFIFPTYTRLRMKDKVRSVCHQIKSPVASLRHGLSVSTQKRSRTRGRKPIEEGAAQEVDEVELDSFNFDDLDNEVDEVEDEVLSALEALDTEWEQWVLTSQDDGILDLGTIEAEFVVPCDDFDGFQFDSHEIAFLQEQLLQARSDAEDPGSERSPVPVPQP